MVKVKELDQITREDFFAYEEVRQSGVINMWNAETGCELAGLDKETWLGIMEHYSELKVKFPGIRK